MSEKERGEILEALVGLPEEKKQFLLGYAAGVVAKAADSEKKDEPDGKKEVQK